MIGSLLEHLDSAPRGAAGSSSASRQAAALAMTLHRPALVDDSSTLRGSADGLIALAAGRPVPPVHRGRCATSRRPVTTCGCARQA